MSDRYLIPCPLVDDLLRVLAHIALQGREVRFGDIVEECIQIIALVWSIEVAAKEQNQFVHEFRLLKDVAFQVVIDDIENLF